MIAIQIITRLYPGTDDDLLEWYAAQGDHYGARSHAIKQALRRGIAAANAPPPSPPMGGKQAIDLGEMRDVVEAAVVTAMSRYSVAANIGDDEAEETEQLLDDLGKALILEA